MSTSDKSALRPPQWARDSGRLQTAMSIHITLIKDPASLFNFSPSLVPYVRQQCLEFMFRLLPRINLTNILANKLIQFLLDMTLVLPLMVFFCKSGDILFAFLLYVGKLILQRQSQVMFAHNGNIYGIPNGFINNHFCNRGN